MEEGPVQGMLLAAFGSVNILTGYAQVRHKWAAEISTQSWARLFRIRTVLRRGHPSQDISTGDLYEQCKVDGKPYLNVTPQDVLETLDNGIEVSTRA